jgi:hypothetical protein
MKTTYKISFFLIALMIAFISLWSSSCNRTVQNGEILGNTTLISAPADFSGVISGTAGIPSAGAPPSRPYSGKLVTNPSYTGIRFGAGAPETIYMTDTFSHEVTWFVEFTGTVSGAKKTFTGTSSYINANMVTWDGGSDLTSRFFVKETMAYKLSFLGTSIQYTGTFIISNGALALKVYSTKVLPDGRVITYTKIDDFDAVAPSIRTSYSDAADGTGAARFFVTDTEQREGFFSYYMKATDNNGNGYCGGSSGELLTELQNSTLETDASKVFFNVYIYGYGRPNSSLFLQAFENDFAVPPTFPLPRNVATNDMWYSIIQVDWVGWKLVSIPYSSFKPANNPLSGGGGNRIREPHKLCGFALNWILIPLRD